MDSEGVKKSFEDLFECPVCFHSIDSVPIDQCQNGHIVCKDCYPKLENCPICRDDKDYNPKLQNLKLDEAIKRYGYKEYWHLIKIWGVIVTIFCTRAVLS